MFHVPDNFRRKPGTSADGNNGIFRIPHYSIKDYFFNVMASDCSMLPEAYKDIPVKWEHCSISLSAYHETGGKAGYKAISVGRTPTWAEMCYIKDLFWDETDTVLQFHPAKSEYINLHAYCLHLWRPIGIDFPIPETWMV